MEKLLNFIKEYKSEYSITSDSTTAEKLRHKAFLHEKTDKEWLELEDEIKQYVGVLQAGNQHLREGHESPGLGKGGICGEENAVHRHVVQGHGIFP